MMHLKSHIRLSKMGHTNSLLRWCRVLGKNNRLILVCSMGCRCFNGLRILRDDCDDHDRDDHGDHGDHGSHDVHGAHICSHKKQLLKRCSRALKRFYSFIYN